MEYLNFKNFHKCYCKYDIRQIFEYSNYLLGFQLGTYSVNITFSTCKCSRVRILLSAGCILMIDIIIQTRIGVAHGPSGPAMARSWSLFECYNIYPMGDPSFGQTTFLGPCDSPEFFKNCFSRSAPGEGEELPSIFEIWGCVYFCYLVI